MSAAIFAATPSHSRTTAYRHCGEPGWLLRSRTDPTRYRLVRASCHDRFCPRCALRRAQHIRAALSNAYEPHATRFLTLTIRAAPDEQLATLLRRLYAAFRRLRARPLWRRHVTGGIALLELTRNSANNAWHPHLHCLIAGSYIAQPDLAAEWLRATGDSRILDIRYARSAAATINYMTKYVTKPLPDHILDDPDSLDEAIRTLRSRKLIVTFGTWRRYKFTAPKSTEDWHCVGHLNELPFKDGLPERLLTLTTLAARQLHDNPDVPHVDFSLDAPYTGASP